MHGSTELSPDGFPNIKRGGVPGEIDAGLRSTAKFHFEAGCPLSWGAARRTVTETMVSLHISTVVLALCMGECGMLGTLAAGNGALPFSRARNKSAKYP